MTCTCNARNTSNKITTFCFYRRKRVLKSYKMQC